MANASLNLRTSCCSVCFPAAAKDSRGISLLDSCAKKCSNRIRTYELYDSEANSNNSARL